MARNGSMLGPGLVGLAGVALSGYGFVTGDGTSLAVGCGGTALAAVIVARSGSGKDV